MMATISRTILATSAVFAASGALAQESTNRVDAERDWSVFVDTNPTACWGVSAPSESVITQDGRVVSAARGDVLLFVTFIPSQNAQGQVSFTGGYPFADGSQVTVEIDGQTFLMFTVPDDDPATKAKEDEMAWTPSPADDAKLIAAMKRGATAVITGKSSRGKTTKDTFSLFGFSSAVEEAEKRCSGG